MIIPDISHYETVKDWKELKKNVPFLIFKGTQRCDYVDPKLKDTIANCEKYGIPYWIYTYLEKGNEARQAEFLVKVCSQYVGDFFVGYCLDAEENNDPGDISKALSVIKYVSKKAMIYTMYSQYKVLKPVIDNRGNNTAWHEARYGLNNGKYNSLFKPHQGVDLHQFTEKGKASYISGNLDLNRLTGTLELEWFTDKSYGVKKDEVKKLYYPFVYPSLPIRGYFKLNDGIKTYVTYREEIKKVQKLANWVTGSTLTVDGMYGVRTASAVRKMQKELNVAADGEFGRKTLTAAKAYYK